MAKLHEILAVEPDLSARATLVTNEARHYFSEKAHAFNGKTRKIQMFSEERSSENSEEQQEIVTTVPEKLQYLASMIGPYYDSVFQKEKTNQSAKADLIVDGNVLARDVPATFLLGMETRLSQLRELYLSIPTLQPGVRWEKDTDRRWVYRAQQNPTMKTEKTIRHKVLYEATDRHPAQIEKWSEDVPIGRIETTSYTGMISPSDKSEILSRIDNLLRAVKKARQRANDTDIIEDRIGETIFDYIHQGIA